MNKMNNLNEFFYFKVGEESKYKIFRINKKHLSLVPLFKQMVNPYDSTTEETAVYIKPIYVTDNCEKNKSFWINTIELFNVILEYVDIWKDDIPNANYIKKEEIQTGNIDQILHKKDLQLILKFVNATVPENLSNLTIYKYNVISSLNPLIKMTDGFLGMEGFAYKIYAFISSIIWNCSLLEIDNVSNEQYFKELQQNQIDEWNKQNNSKIESIL